MEPAAGRPASAADTTATFLVSLYLVLLAFFILLAVISTFDGKKSERVLQSVTARLGAGAGWMPSAAEMGPGNAAALRTAGDLRRELREAFEAEVPGVRFGIRQSGRVLEATMPIEMMFNDASAITRSGMGLLMGRITRAINAAVPAVRSRVEIVVRDILEPELVLGSLSVRRADILARGLRSAGLAEAAVMAGAEHSDRPEIRFVFRILPEPLAAEGG